MNEDLNSMLLRLVQENIQTNQQWSETAILFLGKLGEAIKEDTEYMRRSISRIETMIGKLESELSENVTDPAHLVDVKAEQKDTAQVRYPASFYFRHKFPQDVDNPGYYLLITEDGDQLQYQLFDQQWNPVHSGVLQDKPSDLFQAAALIAHIEGISDYQRYEMVTEAIMEKISSISKADEAMPDDETAVPVAREQLTAENALQNEQVESSETTENESISETLIGEKCGIETDNETRSAEQDKSGLEGGKHDRARGR